MKLILAMYCSIIALVVIGQNEERFFRTVPLVDKSTPSWAILMYSEDPNVGDVIDAYNAYYQVNKFEKTLHTQNFKHWTRQVMPYLNETGYIRVPSRQEEEIRYQEVIQNQSNLNLQKSLGNDTGWVSIGPFETFKKNTTQPVSWHMNVYCLDQSLSNSNVLICGTEGGGVYKSLDKGLSWELITKWLPFTGGTGAVQIHPMNENNFLIAANRRIFQSLDGGQTWTERAFIDATGFDFAQSTADPNLVFLASENGLYTSQDAGVTWTQSIAESCYDVNFHPTNPNVVYTLRKNDVLKRAEVLRSDDAGTTWNLKDNGYLLPANPAQANPAGGKIAVTPAAPDVVYTCLIGSSKSGDGGWIGVYKSSNQGENWVNPAGQAGGPYGSINGNSPWNVAAYGSGYHQGFYNFDFEASPYDSTTLWVGTVRLVESKDGGATFKSIGAVNSTRLGDIHADIQGIEINGDDFWVVSDGGINYSNDTLNTHVARNRGIQAAQFWGFNTGWNEDSYTGGKYHDGTSGWIEKFGVGNAYNLGGVEEASGYVHPIESDKMYFRTHYSSPNTSVVKLPGNLGGNTQNYPSLQRRPNESFSVGERSGVYFDPRYADHIYIGLTNKVHFSKDGGNNFEVLYEFPHSDGKIYEIEISRSNPNVMYCVYNSTGTFYNTNRIWKSTDGGKNWAITASNPGNGRRYRLSINPTDEDEIWVSAVGTIGTADKVYSSQDGGDTWVNRTTPVIAGKALTDIMFQGGTTDLVYILSNEHVYYWNGTDWIAYSEDLPTIINGMQINPFYRDGELRLASNGRGAWARKMVDTTFLPIAQPITYRDTVLCTRDTVQFDCYSILKHDGATWIWNITPAPAYISSASSRNPKVLFGSSGSYTVSLTVTDGQGNTSTKSIPNMVTVTEGCEPDTIPGFALSCQTNNSNITIPDLGLNSTSEFTISAWIKRDGNQNPYAGIVMSNGTSAGLNFTTGNQLAYHWPGGSWSWGSGLVPADGKWEHVALVISPNFVTIYLNGVPSKNYVSVNPAEIKSMRIGSFKGWSSRNFKGEIDEVCIWDKALSQEEIRELRHLTRTGTMPFTQDLLAYYQFNRPGTEVLDRYGGRHTSLSGGTTKVKSTAPVGGGTSARINVNSDGTYVFNSNETEIDFGALNPVGEVVVSRLNILPDSLPNSNPSVKDYWILNYYGTNSFGALDQVKLKPSLGVPFGDMTNARLFVRGENEHLNNWNELCSVSDTTGGVYSFDTNCGINNTVQLFIQSATTDEVVGNYYFSSVDTAICLGDQILLEGSLQNSAGIYNDTIHVSPSEDSIVVTELTVLTPSVGTDIISACGAFTWIDGVTYTASNNTATMILTNAVGCDSVVTLDLTINPLTESVDIISACEPYTWIDGNTYSSSNNTATFTMMSSNGCDSVITLDLTIHPTSSGVDVVSACESYTWIDGNTYTSTNNSATFITTNSNGCDSIITLDLTIGQSTTGVDEVSACEAFTWIDGNTYTSSNSTATFVMTNAVGCDSIVTLDLTMTNIDASIQNANLVLTAFPEAAQYQWMDCSTNMILPGMTGQSFIPTANGEYAVIVTSNSCSDTSECILINSVGLSELEATAISIYPMPSNGDFTIELENGVHLDRIDIWDLSGKIVYSAADFNEMNNGKINIQTELSAAKYQILCRTSKGIIVVPLVVKQ